LEEASGCTRLVIDSESGDIDVFWPDAGKFDPVKALKLPDVIKAISRGMAPANAIQLLQDEWFFEIVELRNHVGKKSNHQRRIRSRLIGSEGKIRKLIEGLTGSQITIYNSTVVIVGEGDGLFLARKAVEMLSQGSEHGTVIKMLEKGRKRNRLENRSIDYIEIKEDDSEISEGFRALVPGLSDVVRRNRRLKSHQVNPDDEEAVIEMMILNADESVRWEEE
jgi:ribosomal RNA assembly protein